MILTEAIGLGLLFSLYLSEVLGFVGGGLVVPGYFVVISSKPYLLLSTIGVSLLSLGALKLASRWALIYGRRRLFLSVLLGFCFAEINRLILQVAPSELIMQLQAFGFILPGLLAYWMDKQGILPALGMLSVVVTIVRLLLIALHGGAYIL